MLENNKVKITQNKIKQKICENSSNSQYKITICKKEMYFSKSFKKKVKKYWDEFKINNLDLAEDKTTYFFKSSKGSKEDLVFPEKFRYVQTIGKTKEFQKCSYPVYSLSSLCLLKTSDNKLVFGIKSNMDGKISGFSGYSCAKDSRKNKINLFSYLCRTLKEELNISKENIKDIFRIGQTFSERILDENNRLNNRAYNNIFLINLNISQKEVKKLFRKNFQFNNLLFFEKKEIVNFISDNYKDFSKHCIGGIFCYFSMNENKNYLKSLMKTHIKNLIDKKETVFITGSSGFIGGYLSKHFSNEYNLIGLDSAQAPKDFPGKFYKNNLEDKKIIKKIFKENKINYVIHAAANKHLRECEKEKNVTYSSNYLATKYLYALSKKVNSKFIFISSDQVFDGKKGDYFENSVKNPINYYGILKDMAEEFLLKDGNVAICRTALVFGNISENQYPSFNKIKDENKLVVQGYIIDHVKHKLSNGETIILPKNEFCNPTSNYMLFKQLEKIIEKNLSGILHCCGGEKISRYNFGLKIADSFGLDHFLIDPSPSNDELRPKDVSMIHKSTSGKMGLKFLDINEMICEIKEEKNEIIC